MPSTRLSIIACIVTLLGSVSFVRADEPSYEGTIDNPSGSTVSVGAMRVSGNFKHGLTVRKPDRITVKITKMGVIQPTYFSGNAMTTNGLTQAAFDTDDLPAAQQPSIPSAGTYIIEVRAEKKLSDGTYDLLKSVSKTVTAN